MSLLKCLTIGLGYWHFASLDPNYMSRLFMELWMQGLKENYPKYLMIKIVGTTINAETLIHSKRNFERIKYILITLSYHWHYICIEQTHLNFVPHFSVQAANLDC